MNLLNKLTIKNLKLNKKRTIVTIIGIILSVALITAVASMYASALTSLIIYEKKEKGNFHVVFYDVAKDDIETFRNNREIEELLLTQNVGYAKITTKNNYKPYAYIKAFPKSSLENLSIKLVEGRLPENEDEILIPTHLNTNGRLSLKVGETLTLNVGKRINEEGFELNQNNPYNPEDIIENVDGNDNILTEESKETITDAVTKTYKIVGIMERPASNIEPYSAPGYTFITYLKDINEAKQVDVFARYTKDGIKKAYPVTANILGVDEKLYEKVNTSERVTVAEEQQYTKEIAKAKYNIDFNRYLIALETNPIKNSGISGLGVVLIIVIIIIIFTSIFCIKNSFDISITEKIKQYGMLRSIGATKKQIKKNVFYEATILGLIGIPLGIIFGILAAFILVKISNFYLNNALTDDLILTFSFSFIAIIIAIILGIITIYLSAFRSAKRASKVSPIDSIRNSANIKINSKKIKSPKIIKKLFGMGGEISFKNLKRNKKKYRTTVISIVVSVLTFIALFSFMSLAFTAIRDELNLYEYNLVLAVNPQDENDDLYQKAMETVKLENIKDYSILKNYNLDFKNPKFNKKYVDFVSTHRGLNNDTGYISIYTVGDYQYQKYVKSLGLDYEKIKDKGILIDYQKVESFNDERDKMEYKYMRIYDYQKGDKLAIVNSEGKVYSNLEIGYVTEKIPFGLQNVNGTKLILSEELYKQYSDYNRLEICFLSSDANKLQDDIDELLKDESYSLDNIEENAKIMNNLYTLIAIFLYGFIIVISLIGITNIFNTITTNMELRRQEFAMLKSIGMTKKEFNHMIRLESLFMGIKSLLFGIPIGIALSYLIFYYLRNGEEAYYKLPILAILISIFVVFILISLIMKYSINKINKQNTIETIRNENI